MPKMVRNALLAVTMVMSFSSTTSGSRMVSTMLWVSCQLRLLSARAARSSLTSSMASRIEPSAMPGRNTLRALTSMVRRPIEGKSCSTSKPSTEARWGMTLSSSVRRAGMSHWPLPSLKMWQPSVSARLVRKVW